MTIQQVNVGIIAASIANNPAGATSKGRVVFTLISADITPGPFGGVTIPSQLEVVLSASGLGSAALYTTSSTQYRVDIYDVNGRKSGEWMATVPAFDCNLHDILGALPLPTVDAAQAAVLAAQGYVAQATTQANNALGYRADTLAYRDTTLTYKNAAQTSASNAATSEGNAGTSAGASATSAGQAAASATLAQQWATSLTVVSGGLFGSKYYANAASTSAAAAAQSAIDANTYAGQASASAIQASGYNATSLGYSNLAQQWATSTSVVTGGFYGALKYAQDAAASAASALAQANAAANSAASMGNAQAATEAARIQAANFVQLASQYAALGASYLQQLFTQLASAATITAAVTSTGVSAGQAQAQASLASSAALSALSVAAQDLSGVTAAALHRSPNAVTALCVYDVSKDSDPNWPERMGDKSWMTEALNGTWLPNTSLGYQSELEARVYGATLGAEAVSNGTFTTDTTGWAAIGGTATTLAAVNGECVITSTGGSNPGMRQVINTTAGKLYVVTATAKNGTMNGGFPRVFFGASFVSGTFGSGTQTIRGVFVATGATAQIDVIFAGGPTVVGAGSFDDISIKEVTALNTKSGDYYQLATDGKFYRLSRNLLKNSVWAGSGGAGTYPTGWGVLGAQANVVSALAQESINGTTTGVVKLRRITNTATLEGIFQTTLGTPLWATGFGMRIMIRVPTGVTAADLVTYDSAGGSVMVASAATLNAQAKDVWVAYTATHTPTASRTSIGFGMNQAAIGAGCDLAMPSLEIGAVTTYDPTDATGEVFRGNTAKFPKQVAIVAEGNGRWVLYDLTQPGRPMWMSFFANGGNLAPFYNTITSTSITALNGVLVLAATTGSSNGYAVQVNFPGDYAAQSRISSSGACGQRYGGNIAQRNASMAYRGATNANYAIAHNDVNAVAMTVLPSAPVDPVTGLQVPTIAVATQGGITVLKDDGTSVNSSLTGSFAHVSLSPSYMLADAAAGLYTVPLAGLPASFAQSFYGVGEAIGAGTDGINASCWMGRSQFARASASANLGIRMTRHNPATIGAFLSANMTGTYSTGWKVGDTRRVLAADAIAGNVTGTERVTNGTFTADVSGWTAEGVSGGTDTTFAWSAGSMQVTRGTGGVTGRPYQQIAGLIPGKVYTLQFDAATSSAAFTIGSVLSGGDVIGPTVAGTGLGIRSTFIAPSTGNAFIAFWPTNGSSNCLIDNVSVKDAAADRSVKAVNSKINGTLSMTAVASAAQLVAVSGFTNDPTQTSEMILNGTFNTDLSSWTPGTGVTWDATAGGRMAFAAGSGWAYQAVPTVAGRKYTLQASAAVNIVYGGAWASVNAGAPNGANLNGGSGQNFNPGANSITFIAQGATSYIFFTASGAGAGAIDNVSVKPSDAIGSAVNVIQENAWSADLDPGTAAFVPGMAWLLAPSTGFGPANFIRNSGNGGAAAGAPGTLPTNWNGAALGTSNGVTAQVAAVVTDSGVPCLDISFSGTATAPVTFFLNTDSLTNVPASVGQAWVASIYSKLVAGVAPAVAPSMKMDGRTAGSADNESSSANISMTGALSRSNVSRTLATAGTVFAAQYLAFAFNNAEVANCTIRLGGPQLERGTVPGPFNLTTGTAYNGIAPIIDRSGPSGAYYRAGIDGNGFMAVELSDGTTTRRATSTVVVNDGTWHQLLGTYATTGALTLFLDGVQNAQATGAALLTLNNANALLTLGNSFALNAAFPGSFALVRTGATVPFAEQIAFMYAQERQMFQAGAQVALPDTGSLVDMSYDDVTDRLKGATAANEFSFTGLVRVESSPAAAGTISKVAMRSGIKLVARITTNPGVDISTPSLNLREELLKRADAAARVDRSIQVLDVDSITSQTDFVLPAGHELVEACSAGALKREGASKDFTRVYDGFKETVRFGTQQGTNWVQLKYRRAA